MSLLRHAVFALVYGALAVAVALTLPYSIDGIERWTAVGIGALVLVFGALVHEVYARQQRERALAERLARMADARDTLHLELAGAREELGAIRTRLMERPGAERTLAEVSAEVRMLQQLVATLVRDGGGAARHRPTRPLAGDAGLDDTGLDDAGLLALVRDAVRHDRIDVALQPIVSLPQRKARHYQAFPCLRTAGGQHLMPARFRRVAESAGLSTAIDNLLLLRCIQLIRSTLQRHRAVGFFAAVSGRSLRDAAFMNEFAEFVSDNTELAPRLVFEVAAAALDADLAPLRAAAARLAPLGSRFALDNVRGLAGLAVAPLAAAQVRVLKVPAAVLLDEAAAGLHVDGLKDQVERNAIDLIVTDIDDEATLREVLDLPIDFGQGRLFGEPRVT